MLGSCHFKGKIICCVAQHINFTVWDYLRLLRIPWQSAF
jgi:hypothetical protein